MRRRQVELPAIGCLTIIGVILLNLLWIGLVAFVLLNIVKFVFNIK